LDWPQLQSVVKSFIGLAPAAVSRIKHFTSSLPHC